MYLARTIARAKWESPALRADEIPAYAVTVDLQAKHNALSLWRCGNASPPDLERVALAVAAQRDFLTTVDIIWIPEAGLVEDGVLLESSLGITPVESLRSYHIDAVGLDLTRLSRIARRMFQGKDSHYRRYTQLEIKQLLADAVRSGLVAKNALSESIQSKIAGLLA